MKITTKNIIRFTKGEFEKRIEDWEYEDESCLHMVAASRIQEWVEEAKKEYPKRADYFAKKGTPYFNETKFLADREKWFVKWFGE